LENLKEKDHIDNLGIDEGITYYYNGSYKKLGKGVNWMHRA